VRANKQPAQPLVLWGYDASPFVNLVKETLSELELPYKQVRQPQGYQMPSVQCVYGPSVPPSLHTDRQLQQAAGF
jgi:hypothetical protein